MRANTVFLILVCAMLCGCANKPETVIEYQCWDGTLVLDLEDCPPTTTTRATTTTTTTTTTLPCQWTPETCRMYCSKECGTAPLEYCTLNEARCTCEYACGKKTTTTTSTTTTTTFAGWLSEKEVDEAINWGIKNKFDMSKLLEEYAYPNYSVGYEHIIVYTPYLNLALAAASKARKYQSLDDSEINAWNTKNDIMFRVKLYGETRNFPDDVNAVIKMRGEVIQPVETTYDDSPEATDQWPKSPAYFAVNTYTFEDYYRIKDRKITFTVIKQTGEDEYTIDMEDYS